MKNIFYLFLLLSISQISHSQVNRNRGQRQNMTPISNEKKIDPIESSVSTLKKELDLNGFQEAVVKNYIIEHQDKVKSVIDEDIPDEAKRNKIEGLITKLNDRVLEILDAEQKEKFNKFLKKKDKR